MCVDFHRNEYYGEPPALLEGLVYVVSQVGHWHHSNEDYINLVGVKPQYATIGWRARRFRKLDELKREASEKQQVPQVA